MKQPFGAKPAGFSTRSMLWIAANRKKEDAAPVSMTARSADPPRMMIVEFQALSGFYCALTKQHVIASTGLWTAIAVERKNGASRRRIT